MVIRIQSNYIKNILYNLYFFSILVMAVTGNNLFWHIVMILSAIWGIFSDKKNILRNIFGAFSLCIITAIFNMLIIGNVNISRLVLFGLSWLMIVFVENLCVNTKLLRITIIIINIYLIFKMITGDALTVSIFKTQSYNYISIYSVLPIIMYYFFAEKNEENIVIWPAFIGALTGMLAYGRGGIITSVFILMVVIANCAFANKKKNTIKKIVLIALLLISILIIGITYDRIINIVFFQKLMKYGLDSRGRTQIWSEYIVETFKNISNFIFGTNTKKINIISLYDGNLHNSILNVHMYNGFFTFIWYIYFNLKCIITGFKYKKWIFLMCVFALILRGFTDNFLWASFGMPIILLLLYEEKTISKSNMLTKVER